MHPDTTLIIWTGAGTVSGAGQVCPFLLAQWEDRADFTVQAGLGAPGIYCSEGRGMGLAEINPPALSAEQPLTLLRLTTEAAETTEAATHRVGGCHPGEEGGPS